MFVAPHATSPVRRIVPPHECASKQRQHQEIPNDRASTPGVPFNHTPTDDPNDTSQCRALSSAPAPTEGAPDGDDEEQATFDQVTNLIDSQADDLLSLLHNFADA
jgi:hypothetical protein